MARMKRNPTEKPMVQTESRQSPAPPSAGEQLEKVKMILIMNGFDVVDIEPRQHEYSTPAYQRPDIYRSPIEFSVNGVTVWLYGSKLIIDDKVTSVNAYNIQDAYKEIVKYAKNKKSEPKKTQTAAPRTTEIARYLKTCIA